MSCLLKFNWVKLPREHLPQGKGVMGSWARLASRAAFRRGQADYCGHRNDVELASWVGGIVGLKSILGINSRQKAIETMDKLSQLGYVSYGIEKGTSCPAPTAAWFSIQKPYWRGKYRAFSRENCTYFGRNTYFGAKYSFCWF